MGDYIRDGFGVDIQPLVGAATGAGEDIGGALKEWMAKGEAAATGYFDQVKEFYKSFTASGGNKSDADIAQHFMLQGLDVINRGAGLAASAGVVGTDTALRVSNAMTATADGIKAGFSLGSGEGGSLDKIKDVDTLIKSTVSIAKALGANAGTADLVQQWASVGTGCATMIMSAGPIWGAAGCAASALFQALSMAAAEATTTKPGIPLATLSLNAPLDKSFRPEISQQTIVARDAMLLAQVLKFHYGLTSAQPLSDALCWRGLWFTDGPPNPEAGEFLWGRTVEIFRGYDRFLGPNKEQKPLVDLSSMLLAVAALDRTEPTSFHATDADLVEVARRVCDKEWDEACRCDWIGNNPCGWYKNPSPEHLLTRQFYENGELNQAGIAVGASMGRGRVAQSLPVGSLLKFVRVDELINFFYAVSLNTRRQDPDTWELELKRFLIPTLPVRFNRLPELQQTRAWTHLNIMCEPNRCGSTVDLWKDRAPANDLWGRVHEDWSGDNVEAQREYAALRLMAAMSYLVWAYQLSLAGDTISDPFKAGPQVTVGSVEWNARMPMDPRQIVQTSPGVYVPNTWDGGHPWDPNMGAEIKTYAQPSALQTTFQTWGQQGSAPFADPTAGVHYGSAWRSQTTRDGRWLHRWIQAREDRYRGIIEQAHRAAADAALQASASIRLPSISMTKASMGLVGAQLTTTAKMWAAIQDKGLLMTTAQGQANTKANCEAGGGYIDAEGYCKPTPATEDACRATGGTPYWDPVYKYKCIPPGEAPPTSVGGGGGGGGLGLVLFAGAALLLAKFMK